MSAQVVLIQPKVCAEPAYPLGLASLIPPLQAAGQRVEGLDLHFTPWEQVLRRATQADVVGITVMTRAVPEVQRLVAALRRRRPSGLRVVVGGPQPSLFPRETLEQTGADVAVCGDGGRLLPQLLEGAPAALPGVVWRDSTIACLPPSPPEPPDEQPWPDREVFPMAAYALAMRAVALPYTPVVTSRGCRRHCAHCPAPRLHPAGFQARSPEHVWGEWEWLSRRYGIRDVQLEDDDPFADPDRIHRLCERLIRRPLPLIWECVNGIPPERLEPALFPLLARAGCKLLVIAFEHLRWGTTTPALPDALGASRVQARTLIRAAHKVGIEVGGYFMVGMPEHARREMLSGVLASYGLGLARANYSAFQWLPGSERLTERLTEPLTERLGPARGLGGNPGGWASTSTFSAPEVTGLAASWGVQQLAAWAHVGFYLQPRPLWKLLESVWQEPGQLRWMWQKGREQLTGAAAGPFAPRLGL